MSVNKCKIVSAQNDFFILRNFAQSARKKSARNNENPLMINHLRRGLSQNGETNLRGVYNLSCLRGFSRQCGIYDFQAVEQLFLEGKNNTCYVGSDWDIVQCEYWEVKR